eukprot:3026246-Pyramimonas_sp.AAC.1
MVMMMVMMILMMKMPMMMMLLMMMTMMMMMMMTMISQSPRPRCSGFTRRWIRSAGACSKSVTGLTPRSLSGWSPRRPGRIWFATFSRNADRPPIARRFTAGFQDVVARLAG